MRLPGMLQRYAPVLYSEATTEDLMCSHYQTLKDAELLLKKFGVTRPGALGKYDMWPRYRARLCAGHPSMTQATKPWRTVNRS